MGDRLYPEFNVDINLSQATGDYLAAMSNRRLTDATLDTYGTILRKFGEYFAPDDPIPEAIQARHIDRFFSGLRHLSDKRVLNYYVALSSFWTWMQRRGYVSQHVVKMIDVPKPGDAQVIPYTREEVQVMLDATWEMPWIGVMLRAVILLMVGTGIRNSEVCNLVVRDLEDEHVLIRNGKGKKSRRVYVPEQARDAIQLYLATRRNVKPDDPVFLNGLMGTLSRARLYKIITKLGEDAGIDKPTVHKFRHFFATEFLKAGGDIKFLKEILGHSDIRTTERYLYVNQEAVTNAARKFNPLESLRI